MKVSAENHTHLANQLKNAAVNNAALPRDDLKYLRSVLTPDKAGLVNEEQLFAGIAEERIKISKGTDIATRFHERFELAKSRIGKKANVIENAARRALNFLTKHGLLSSKEATKIHSEAFAAAQIDENKDKLFDSIGGGKDTTVATKNIDQAVNLAADRLNAFDSGNTSAQTRVITEVL